MMFVMVPPPEYESEINEAEPVHVLLVTSLVTSDESSWNVGEDMVIEEPEASVTEKLPELTVIDCIAALEPETSRVYPPTESMAFVVSVTSLYAASASDGIMNAKAQPAASSFRILLEVAYVRAGGRGEREGRGSRGDVRIDRAAVRAIKLQARGLCSGHCCRTQQSS